MFRLIKRSLLLGALLSGLVLATPLIAQAAPIDVLQQCDAAAEGKVCQGGGGGVFAMIKNIINLLITIGGTISVIMVIVGGIKYSTSAGDPQAISSGRNTIVYAIVGLVISIMSFAIVNFVLGKL